MSRSDEVYRPVLVGKKIPILTLDNKWHQLFTQLGTIPAIKEREEQLNDLVKRQGKLNTESKDLKKIKSKLMEEIRDIALDEEKLMQSSTMKKMKDNKRLINDCNQKFEAYQDELMEIPKKIDEVNYELMVLTMESCYETLTNNTEQIDEISEWISRIRSELKEKIIKKQEMELMNHQLYAYMHNIFGARVIDIFDLKYNPAEKMIKKPVKQKVQKDSDAT